MVEFKFAARIIAAILLIILGVQLVWSSSGLGFSLHRQELRLAFTHPTPMSTPNPTTQPTPSPSATCTKSASRRVIQSNQTMLVSEQHHCVFTSLPMPLSLTVGTPLHVKLALYAGAQMTSAKDCSFRGQNVKATCRLSRHIHSTQPPHLCAALQAGKKLCSYAPAWRPVHPKTSSYTRWWLTAIVLRTW